jgi:hypothetical protein
MPSLVPLNNAIAQSRVDFNNQTPSNAGGLFRYKINNYGFTAHTFNSNDLNAVCIFARDVSPVMPLASSFSAPPPIGSEILFYSTSGYVRLVPESAGVDLYCSVGNYTLGPNFIGKIIYKGNDDWFFASANFTSYSYSWDNCCGEFGVNLLQIKTVNDENIFSTAQRSYVDTDLTIPFNGTVYAVEATTYYNIANGYNVGSVGSCVNYSYSTPYTFFTGADPDADAVTFYSVADLTITDTASLAGKKFFTSDVGAQADCYTSDMVSPGAETSYYSSTASYPGSPLGFRDGYLVQIDNYL